MDSRKKAWIAFAALFILGWLGWFIAITSLSAVREARQRLHCATSYTLAQEANGDIPEYCKRFNNE